MSTDPVDLTAVSAEYLAFRARFQTLVLATGDGEILGASYAPFVMHAGDMYIYVSELAAHTRHLLKQGQCAVLLIEDEQDCRNLFARRRISYQCQVDEVVPDTPTAAQVLGTMRERFGNVVDLLRSLPGFHLFRLQATEGSYVAGFGKAYAIDAAGNMRQSRRG